MVGFGSLMISSDRGINSLGLLVALGVGSVLLASLTVLPSLLAVLAARAGKRAAWMMDHQTRWSKENGLGLRHTCGMTKRINEGNDVT